MSGNEILLDTNILLYFLQGDKNVRTFFFDHTPAISFITELEILSSSELSERDKSNIRQLLSEINVLSFADKYKQTIIDTRAIKKLKLPDAIIAGTAIALGLPLVTADTAFKGLPSLDLVLYSIPGNE